MTRNNAQETEVANGGLFTWLKGLFVAPGDGSAGQSANGGKPGAPPKSVEKAASKSGRRGKAAREEISKDGARKPPARKIAHRAGAGMADAIKADTNDRAKQASRARKASQTKR